MKEYTESDDRGTSIVLVRGGPGEDLLDAVGRAALELAPLSAAKAAQSQRNAILWKKDWLQAKASLARLSGRRAPTYQQDLPAPRLADYAGASAQVVTRSLRRQWHRVRGFDA